MELKYGNITERIIGCAMKVHGKMGVGYPELIYSKCLGIEFDKTGLKYEKEASLSIYYDEFVVGMRRVDFMVEQKIIVELKAVGELSDKDIVQSLNYLESHRQEVALLINFGAKSLQFKRIINNKNINLPANPSNLTNEPVMDYTTNKPSKNLDPLRSHPDNPFTNPENPWS